MFFSEWNNIWAPFQTLLAIVILLLPSCASLSKTECESGDWYTVGLNDGGEGLPFSRFEDHVKSCTHYMIKPDEEIYKKGYLAGLQSYCHPLHLTKVGMKGKQYHGVCGGEGKDISLKAYLNGTHVGNARSSLEDARQKLEETEQALRQAKAHNRLENSQNLEPKKLKDTHKLEVEIERLLSDISRHEIDLKEAQERANKFIAQHQSKFAVPTN